MSEFARESARATAERSAPTIPAPLDCLDHVAVSVEDIAAAVSWYRERFRCEILHQDPTWALLGFDNVRLALVVPGQHPPHVAFRCERAETFGELRTHRDGTRSTYIADPFGNAVEIMADD